MIGEITPTMPVAPAYGGNSSEMGGSWIWILLIVLLLGGRGSLLGGDGAAANGAANMINNDFLYTQQKVDNLSQNLVNQTNLLNQAMNTGFDGLNMGLCNLGNRMDAGFCGINRNIDQVRFENAQNTCTITTAIGESTQAIKDLINSNTMQDLRDRNVELTAALNNSAQTADIINKLRPYPVPSYLTLPPNVPFGYQPYGGAPFHGNHCGCNPCGNCC